MSSSKNSIKWEKVQENKKENSKKIIWKSYKDDKSFLKKSKKNIDKAQMEPTTWRNRILRFTFEEIDMPDAGEQMGLAV